MPCMNLFPHRITLQAKSTANQSGGQVVSYSPSYANIPALVRPASSTRMLLYHQRNIEISHTIATARPISASTGDIVVFGTRQFLITGLRNMLESGRWFEILAREITGTELLAAPEGGSGDE